MTTTDDWTCPSCGSNDTEINTWEAWCFTCDWHIEKDAEPKLFAKLREAELARRESDQRMNPMEFKMAREYQGLGTEHLAAILNVRHDTVRRWESGREPIPYRTREEVEMIEAHTARSVTQLITALKDAAEPTVALYRTDADMHFDRPDTSHLPARWWRMVVARACHEVPGVQIVTAEPE